MLQNLNKIIISKLRNGERDADIAKEKRKPINVLLAFPYNPYHPEPYNRFTEVGMMDIPNDFLIGDAYWDFIGGKDTFPELLETFNEVGKQFKAKLNKKFKEIAKEKLDSF